MVAMVLTAATTCPYTLPANATLLAADAMCLQARATVCVVTASATVGHACNVTKTFPDAQTTFTDMTLLGDVRSYTAPTLTLQSAAATTIDLSSMQLSPSIHTLSFQGYSSLRGWPALPTTLTTLKVQNAGMTAPPSVTAASSLAALDLSSNKLTSLASNALPTSLTSLNLASNQLTAFGALDGIRLTSLNLDENPLQSIENLQMTSEAPAFSCAKCSLSSFSMDRTTYDGLSQLPAPASFVFASPTQCAGSIEDLWGMKACVFGAKALNSEFPLLHLFELMRCVASVILAGCIGAAVVFAVAAFIYCRHYKHMREAKRTARENDTAYVLQVKDLQTMRDIDLLGDFRLPLDQVVVLDRLSTGDLWKGLFEGHVVSIRYLFTSSSTTSEMQTGIQQVLAATRLDSRYVLALHGVSWTTPKDLMLVQEYMDMGDLETYLRNLNTQQILWKWKTKTLEQIVSALAYLHNTANFVHGHVCAANVLLDGVKGAKLMMLDAQAPSSSFRYMAPELDTHDVPYGHWHDDVNDEDEDDDEDKATTTHDQAEEDKRLMQRIMDGDVAPVFTPACPSWVQSLATRCLSPNPLDRPSAVTIQHELETTRASYY
ncbi:serine/threonine protein kinase [Saprolegnia parasitica CBS 223.65]|uniref:Serine/threonine protein kinase n=1 Tax=Saprolegnia parasitica (strain CBS 223.65) TaxID=695850 RepID=A0A067CE73_SAPPC|nr:serine/threonine protein kinase [Saprolegnia parasitica CBS 223.65]KDO25107.1 serine/threonine protein kinase [Saprolegnia parasitica CBS 223.65]|eukprot:XP_012204233.1 serine/threonine protein kinase [Saprolegnia parasitica CBS 223.65]